MQINSSSPLISPDALYASIDDILAELQKIEENNFDNPSIDIVKKTIELSEFALASISDSNDSSLALGGFYYFLAWGQYYLDLYNDSFNNAKKSIENLKGTESLQYLYKSYRIASQILWLKGKFSEGLEYMLADLEILQKLDNKKEQSTLHNNLGAVYRNIGDSQSALAHYEQAIAIMEQLDDKLGIGNTIGNIGVIYHQQKNYERALEYYAQSLQIKEQYGNKKSLLTTIFNIATVYSYNGENEQALELFFKAKEMSEEINSPTTNATISGFIGDIYTQQGNYEDAVLYLNQALDISKSLENNRFHFLMVIFLICILLQILKEKILIWRAHICCKL